LLCLNPYKPQLKFEDLDNGGGLTIARARFFWIFRLKIADPTKILSAPICLMRAASAGVAMPPAAKSWNRKTLTWLLNDNS